MDIIQTIDLFIKYGATGVLAVWVFYLRKDISQLGADLKRSNEEHKKDLRDHNTELKVLIENIKDLIK